MRSQYKKTIDIDIFIRSCVTDLLSETLAELKTLFKLNIPIQIGKKDVFIPRLTELKVKYLQILIKYDD